MPTLDRDGVRIHYAAHGSGPAVLLTHGYAATSRMWEPQVAALAPRSRMIAWDMRGHGASDSPDDPARYSHALAIADMAAVLDACEAPRAVVGGLSLGGFLSLAFHRAHPERVRALMLFDTGPGYRKDEARAGWNRFAEKQARAFETRGLDALARSTEVRAADHRSAQGLAHAARGILAQRDAGVIESLPAIRVPTLLVAGAEDEPYLAGMEYMAAKIPGARMVLIPGAGHAPNLEQPAAFNAAVREFLGSLPDD